MAAQATDEQRRELATYVVDNGGDRAHLEAQIKEIWADLERRLAEHDRSRKIPENRPAPRQTGPGIPVTARRYDEGMPALQMVSEFSPAGDQPEAIAALATGVERGDKYQTLLGITGSGKSFTIAGVIEKVQRPTIVLAPNKSLAAQLASEFRELFPKNRVEYFVSYYDYYQPEAYLPTTDTYIEKDSSINDEIDRLRHSATSALMSPARRDHRGVGLGDLRTGRSRGVRAAVPDPRQG